MLAPELNAAAIRAATGSSANHNRPCRSVVTDIVSGATRSAGESAIGAAGFNVSGDRLLTTQSLEVTSGTTPRCRRARRRETATCRTQPIGSAEHHRAAHSTFTAQGSTHVGDRNPQHDGGPMQTRLNVDRVHHFPELPGNIAVRLGRGEGPFGVDIGQAHRHRSRSLHLRQRQIGSDGNLPCLPDAFRRSGKEATPQVLITALQGVPKSQCVHRRHCHPLCVNGIETADCVSPHRAHTAHASTVKRRRACGIAK